MASIIMSLSKKPADILKNKLHLSKNPNPKRSVSFVPRCSFPLNLMKNKKGSQTRFGFLPSGTTDLSSLLGSDFFDSEMEDELYDDEEEQVMMKRWKARELEDGVELKVNMPGFGKDDIKVTVEDDASLVICTLLGKEDDEKPAAGLNVDPDVVVNGEPDNSNNNPEYDDDSDDEDGTMIIFDLDVDLLNLQALKAEMKNGLLKIFIPKVKVEKKKKKNVVEVVVQ
ncbi:hypothetical protein MKW94_027887 [Papaver nudicaule]|uniref:SHSP domain-containing protein n=1 Tax=Papaver nudicaule TaxID=74823 RepID=A0AA41W0H5_PAPNU|nr:hypothetical protein [Papaver nudicaule]